MQNFSSEVLGRQAAKRDLKAMKHNQADLETLLNSLHITWFFLKKKVSYS